MEYVAARVRSQFATLIEKTGLRRQLVDTLFSLVGINLLVAGLSFATTIAIANVLGTKAFGDLAFAIAVGTYGLMFVRYGLEKSLVRELVHFPERFGELLKGSLWVRLVLFVVLLVFLLVGTAVFREHLGFSWGMLLVTVATASRAFQLSGVYDAWKKMRKHAVYFLVERCTYFALVWAVILIPLWTLSLEVVGCLMMATVAAGLFLQYRWALPRIDFKPVQGTWPAATHIIHSNIFIWLAVLSGLSLSYLNQIILRWYAGSSELGLYSVAWRISQLGILFLTQAGRIGAEATARHTRPGAAVRARTRFLAKYALFMTMIGFLTGLPCLLLPRQLLLVLRPEYADAAESLRLLGFYPLLYGPYLAVLQYVVSSRMQKTYFALISAVGVVSIGFSLWLIPGMQSRGAAISVVISLAVALAVFVVAVGVHLRRLAQPVAISS